MRVDCPVAVPLLPAGQTPSSPRRHANGQQSRRAARSSFLEVVSFVFLQGANVQSSYRQSSGVYDRSSFRAGAGVPGHAGRSHAHFLARQRRLPQHGGKPRTHGLCSPDVGCSGFPQSRLPLSRAQRMSSRPETQVSMPTLQSRPPPRLITGCGGTTESSALFPFLFYCVQDAEGWGYDMIRSS